LLGSGSVTKSSANLLAVGVGAGVGLGFLGVGLFVSIVMAVVASVLFLGLLMMKVVLAISTVLVFIGMPIAIVLSPVVSWIPRLRQRRGELPRPHQQREVERNDLTHDAQRLLEVVGVGLVIDL
jgi:hypothetical protein